MSKRDILESLARKITGDNEIKCSSVKNALLQIAKKAKGSDIECTSINDTLKYINDNIENLIGGKTLKYKLYAWKNGENIVYTEKETPQVHDLALTAGGEFLEVLGIYSATIINVHGDTYTRDAESDLEESVSSFESIPTVTQNGALLSADGKVFKAVNVNVPVGGVNKLFCWKKENENHYAYTTSENPRANDKAIVGGNELYTDTIWELITDGINLDVEGPHYRYSAKDVAL